MRRSGLLAVRPQWGLLASVAQLGVSQPTVRKWRARNPEEGLAGLRNEPRPGRPRTLDDQRVAVLLNKALQTRPAVRSDTLADTFALGLESFFTEARLASFDHPTLVKVYRVWKAHGTAYMAMPYYPGTPLKQVRQGMLRSPHEAWLRAFVEPLLGVLELLHGEGVFHRDTRRSGPTLGAGCT